VALCRLLLSKPDLLLLDSPPTTSTPSPSPGSKGRCRTTRHRRRRHPRRYFLDNVAGWILELDRGGHPWEGNYSSCSSKSRHACGEEKADRSRQPLSSASSSDPIRHGHARARARLVSMPTTTSSPRRSGRARRTSSRSPSLRAPARGPGGRSGDVTKDSVTASSSTISRSSCRRRDRRVIGRTAQARHLFRMIVGDDCADAGRLDVGPTVVLGYVDSPRRARADTTVFDRSPGARPNRGRNRELTPGLCGQLRFKGTHSRRSGPALWWRAKRVQLAKC